MFLQMLLIWSLTTARVNGPKYSRMLSIAYLCRTGPTIDHRLLKTPTLPLLCIMKLQSYLIPRISYVVHLLGIVIHNL
jgi:hypothetical protein